MEVSSQLHAPAALLPGKVPPAPIGKEVRWASESVWMLCSREKSSTLAGNRTPSVQHVASRYTDCAMSYVVTLLLNLSGGIVLMRRMTGGNEKLTKTPKPKIEFAPGILAILQRILYNPRLNSQPEGRLYSLRPFLVCTRSLRRSLTPYIATSFCVRVL
jgi:hypothetical protein